MCGNGWDLLEKFFTKEVDYQVIKAAPPIGGAAFEIEIPAPEVAGAKNDEEVFRQLAENPLGGRPKETIMLSVNT